MITRYSRPEMRAIWTDENKLKIWLQIELLASEALEILNASKITALIVTDGRTPVGILRLHDILQVGVA